MSTWSQAKPMAPEFFRLVDKTPISSEVCYQRFLLEYDSASYPIMLTVPTDSFSSSLEIASQHRADLDWPMTSADYRFSNVWSPCLTAPKFPVTDIALNFDQRHCLTVALMMSVMHSLQSWIRERDEDDRPHVSAENSHKAAARRKIV